MKFDNDNLFQAARDALAQDSEAVFLDTIKYGTGFSINGKHVPLESVYIDEPTAETVVEAIAADYARAKGRAAAGAYMKARKIGESAVDLIPDEVKRPFDKRGDWMFEKMKIQKSLGAKFDGLYWTHTPGILKLTAWFVRLAWNIRG